MRGYAVIAILMFAPGLWPAGNKLTWEDRVELNRGLTAEYATVKALLPRSRKALEFDAASGYDKKQWAEIARESGPAARNGDLVQITKVEIDDDKLVLQINGGFKGGRKWYQGVQIGVGGATAPVSTNSDSNAPGGTSIAIMFHKPLEPIKASEIKKMLAPVLDFEKHSVTQLYSESLPPETQAVFDKYKLVTFPDRLDYVKVARDKQDILSLTQMREFFDLKDKLIANRDQPSRIGGCRRRLGRRSGSRGSHRGGRAHLLGRPAITGRHPRERRVWAFGA